MRKIFRSPRSYPRAHKSAGAEMPTEKPNGRNIFVSNLEL
ncbi:unnamed protein product [Gulo gulo]|uniref:Uncharacterized protein n=1 Tax=Gulo gulo TaxID=48420 RepID=A0A9X9QAY3_GULGU|nr:unnamed protein product [Gulo gulo]